MPHAGILWKSIKPPPPDKSHYPGHVFRARPQPFAGHPTRSSSEKRPSILHKVQIAFVPENEVIPEEMLDLEEQLEHDHHPEEDEENIRRESLRDSVIDRNTSLVIPVGQIIRPVAYRSSIQFQDYEEGKDKEEIHPAYDHLPRPYLRHWKDIERRRTRKMMDIMNATPEQFTFSEKDKRVKFASTGCLIFHVLEFFHLAVNATTFIRSLPVSFYCVLNMGSVKRCSKIFHSRTFGRVRVDFAANFSVELSEWRESPSNRFTMELWSYQDPEIHYIVGIIEIHAYKFVRKAHAVEVQELWSDGIKVGKVAFEYSFAYGCFGYGHSNHLKNPSNPIMETVCHSMYPRIRLDGKDISDSVYSVRMPNELKVFTYNSLILELDLEAESQPQNKRNAAPHKEILEPKPMLIQQVIFEADKPVHCKLHMNIWQSEIQADFNDAYGEYICNGTRRNRMEYLNNLISGRMRDIRETDDASWLFRSFKEREAERVSKAEVKPAYLVFPQKIPCPSDIVPIPMTKEDEAFQLNFPAVRRQNGFLATLFGFEKKPEASEDLNDMDYPLYQEAGKVKRRINILGCLTRFFIRIGAILNFIFNFVFPEIHTEPQVPELSLTTPTPEGSTTKVFSYFVRDPKDTGPGKVEKLQAQTAALVEITDGPSAGVESDGDDSADTASSSDGEGGDTQKPKRLTATVADGGGGNKQVKLPGSRPPVGKDANFHFKAGLNQPIQDG